MAQCNFKFIANFGLTCQYYILISYIDCTDETRRSTLEVYNKKVIECIYCEIFGSRSHGGDALSPYELVPNILQYTFNNL